MLFNSYEFVLLFLPLAVTGFYLLAHWRGARAALIWLLLASLFFYGWFNPVYLLLLLASIFCNYQIGSKLLEQHKTRRARFWLLLGLCFNLGLLAYFKYANFFLDNLAMLGGPQFDSLTILLPLGISFFTFQQIAFLIDVWRGEVRQLDPLRYSVFVAFFPQLIAGPIVQHREIFPQLLSSQTGRFDLDDVNRGLSRFALGLFKKVVIADSLAQLADPVFAPANAGVSFSSLDYSLAVLAFSLQIYFDFSAYSDMAVGLGRMFGIRLPENFESPYKARSIIDFWRRWHITLSRFLRHYLYIPLGGNRRGKLRRYANLMLTMALGGLWHGAQWQFVIWGLLHGAFLCINHGWRRLHGAGMSLLSSLMSHLAWLLTLLAISVAWIFFRANSSAQAWEILDTIITANSWELSPGFQFVLTGSSASGLFSALGNNWIYAYIALMLAWVLFLPNSRQLTEPGQTPQTWAWQRSTGWALATAACLFLSVMALDQVNAFIYFQF